jgi:hypothetical protein
VVPEVARREFAVLEVARDQVSVGFVGTAGEELYRYDVRK